MEGGDSFDTGDFETQGSAFAISTTWGTRVEPKLKGRRTYGRRGSDAVVAGIRVNKKSNDVFPTSRNTSPFWATNSGLDENSGEDEDTDVEDQEPWRPITSPEPPTFSRDFSINTPPTRRRKKFVRANTITGSSPVISRPIRPPNLMRSHSVSTLMPERSFSCPSRSFTSSASLAGEGGDHENFHPNFLSSSDNYEDDTSPKRSAASEAERKGRKKCKPTSNSFMQNDFSALSNGASIGASNCDNNLPQCAPHSFSGLARNHGKVGSTWATRSDGALPSNYITNNEVPYRRRRSSTSDLISPGMFCHDDHMDGGDSLSSPTTSMASATRKRGVCKSQPFYDDSPVSRSRSRMFSPPSVRSSDTSLVNRTTLMDISFHSTKKSKNSDRAALDVTMSDDDANVSRDSDISVDSEDEGMSSDNGHDGRRPLSTTSYRIFEPDKATTDDITKHMSSYEDIQYLATSLQQNYDRQGGCVCWSLAPPVSWAAKRRDTFFQATRRLGFTFRSGGGNVCYIQISKKRGNGLLSLLKSTLETYDERKLRERTPAAHFTPRFTFASTVKKQLKPGSRVSKMLRLTPKELTPSSWCQKSNDKATDELAQIMGKLDMNAKLPAVKTTPKYDAESCLNGHDSHSRSSKPRKSLEYHASSSDLNAHMHGSTPVPPRFRGRPPRLSLQSVSSRSTLSTNMDVQSPFVNSSKPSHINTNNSNCGMNTDDLVYTPLVGRQDEWGSRPFNDRDWGTSNACESVVTRKLSRRLIKALKNAGFEGKEIDELDGIASPCLGLDFDAAAQYTDEFESPRSSSSQDDAGIDGSTGSYLSEVDSSDGDRMNDLFFDRTVKRRQTTFAKHKRMSLFASAVNPTEAFSKHRKSLFVRQPTAFAPSKQQVIIDESTPEFYFQNYHLKDSSVFEIMTSKEKSPLEDDKILRGIFDFLEEQELFFVASLVSKKWSDVATHSLANTMMSTVAIDEENLGHNDDLKCFQRSWDYLMSTFPWACFLSEGAFKRVYKVFNHSCRAEEAISVMDVKQIHSTGNLDVVRMELAVSVMLSSLVRFRICPNFVATRHMFTCQYEPPDNHWGTADNKRPKGAVYSSPKSKRRPKEPKDRGHFQYIRMELCEEGDAEEFLKRQVDECLDPVQARNLLFQIAFALYAAAEKFSLKHYDLKLLNVFLKRMPQENEGNVVLRYGLGGHTFALQSSREDAIIAKLADYGTANVDCVTNGQNVTIAQFTTLENTPPDFLILGDDARQGHGHDCFGLGLCMLHLFTGHAPYEEILEGVTCPSNLKKELRRIWENEDETQYSVVRSIVLDNVYKDEDGNIIEGEADETLYDTLYKFLVLFGIPDDSVGVLDTKVMAAVKATLDSEGRQKKVRGRNRKVPCDEKKFESDRRKFSLSHGTDKFISRARASLSAMDGGMELLRALVQFNPQRRASALDVLNSSFMAPLRELPNENQSYSDGDEVLSFTAFSTQTKR